MVRVSVLLICAIILACSGDSSPIANSSPVHLERTVQTIHPVLGVRIAAEVDDGSYERKDYDYPSSIEADIVNRQGGLFSPYSLNCFDSASETDIEHIVATAEAHASGMYAKSEEDRSAYGKDLDNLTLAAPAVNRNQKSDKDPAEWMPDNNRCWYVGKWVEIKKKYNLTMDQTEADSVVAVYQECDSFDMIVPVCAAGLAESDYYDFRWSRWGDTKEEVQSTELDTLTFSQVDSTQETGSVAGVLQFSDEISDTVTISYLFTDNALSSGSYAFETDVPSSRLDSIKTVLDERYGFSEETEEFTVWRRNERTWVRLYAATQNDPMRIDYIEQPTSSDSSYNDLPLRVVVPDE